MLRFFTRICTLFQIFKRRAQHQLDPVQLVYLAGARIVVDGYDVGAGVPSAQFFDDALSDDMIWQAGEGLGTDDVLRAPFDQLQHLAGQEPAFPGLIAKGDDFLRHIRHVIDVRGGGEMNALLQRLIRRPAEELKRPDSQASVSGSGFLFHAFRFCYRLCL